MLPTTLKKVWFFWTITALGLLTLGLWKLGVIHFSDSPSGFILGFTAAFLVSSIIISIHYLKTNDHRTCALVQPGPNRSRLPSCFKQSALGSAGQLCSLGVAIEVFHAAS